MSKTPAKKPREGRKPSTSRQTTTSAGNIGPLTTEPPSPEKFVPDVQADFHRDGSSFSLHGNTDRTPHINHEPAEAESPVIAGTSGESSFALSPHLISFNLIPPDADLSRSRSSVLEQEASLSFRAEVSKPSALQSQPDNYGRDDPSIVVGYSSSPSPLRGGPSSSSSASLPPSDVPVYGHVLREQQQGEVLAGRICILGHVLTADEQICSLCGNPSPDFMGHGLSMAAPQMGQVFDGAAFQTGVLGLPSISPARPPIASRQHTSCFASVGCFYAHAIIALIALAVLCVSLSSTYWLEKDDSTSDSTRFVYHTGLFKACYTVQYRTARNVWQQCPEVCETLPVDIPNLKACPVPTITNSTGIVPEYGCNMNDMQVSRAFVLVSVVSLAVVAATVVATVIQVKCISNDKKVLGTIMGFVMLVGTVSLLICLAVFSAAFQRQSCLQGPYCESEAPTCSYGWGFIIAGLVVIIELGVCVSLLAVSCCCGESRPTAQQVTIAAPPQPQPQQGTVVGSPYMI